MLGNLKYVRARTSAGKLTNFKTGDRFVDIVVSPEPLPKKKIYGTVYCLFVSQRAGTDPVRDRMWKL